MAAICCLLVTFLDSINGYQVYHCYCSVSLHRGVGNLINLGGGGDSTKHGNLESLNSRKWCYQSLLSLFREAFS